MRWPPAAQARRSLRRALQRGSPRPSETVASISPDTAEAIRFRTSVGLRADRAYVEAVARDPRARIWLVHIPLLPEEDAELEARATNADEIVPIVEAHAADFRDEYGGVYIDQKHGGAVTSLWTANLSAHEAAIRAKIGPRARVAFREVAFSYHEPQALQARIHADHDWLRAIDAQMTSISVDVIENVTLLTVSSANPDADRLINEHYAVGDMLRVESDGTGIVLLPKSSIRGRVVDPLGRPVPDLSLVWVPDSAGICGILDMGFGTSEDGEFEIPHCTPGGWTIRAGYNIDQIFGDGHVVVRPGQDARLEIRLQVVPLSQP